MSLPDIQNIEDVRDKHINKVGIREYEVPIKVFDNKHNIINTVGVFSIYCSLNKNIKGVNMSRFAELIEDAIQYHVSSGIIDNLLEKIKVKLESENSFIKIKFPYFINKESPVEHKKGHIKIDCVLVGRLENGVCKKYLEVKVPYTSCCPCSREISEDGAHNQRSCAAITVELDEKSILIETIVDLVEKQASCPIYSVLKRPDEKYVTETAYNNPKFVEDMARDLAISFDQFIGRGIKDYVIVIEHDESIHQHKAVSIINAGRELQ